MATVTERLALIISASGATAAAGEVKKVETAFGGITQQLGGSGGLGKSIQSAFGSLGGLSSAAGPAGAAIGAGIAGLTAEAAAAGKAIEAFSGATAQVRAFQRVTGGTAQDSSKLVYAFHALGIDSDKAGTAVFRLAHNLDGGQDKLQQMGVQIAHARDGSIDLTNTMLNVADAIHKIGPGAEADAIAFAAFGRQATALLPVLLRGRQGLEELFHEADRHHQVFSQDDLESGKKFDLAMKSLKESLVGLEIEGGKVLIPLATSVARDGEKILHFFDQAANDIGGFISHIPGHTNALHSMTLGLYDSSKGHKDLADAATQTADAVDAEAAVVKDAAKALDNYGKAVSGVTDATKNRENAVRSVGKAQQDEASAVRTLSDLQAKGAVDADAVAAAEKNVAAAARATTDAQRGEAQAAQRVADAQQAVVDAQLVLDKVKAGATPEDIEKAELAAAKAQRDRARSQIALAEAIDKTNVAATDSVIGVGSGADKAREQEQANLDLADATDNVKLADLSAKDAQDALTKIQQQGKEGSDDLKKAQDDLKAKQDDLNKAIQDQADAHQNVIDKQTAEIGAHDDLVKAQAGDPDFDRKLADARQAVADAHQNTADAINNERDAIDGLIQKQKELAAFLSSPEAAATNVQTSAINGQDFRPVSRSATQVFNTTINAGADPNVITRALAQHAASNGGKPR